MTNMLSLHKRWLLHHPLPSAITRNPLVYNRRFLQVRAQSCYDDNDEATGRSWGQVANEDLRSLSKRIEEIRMKERLERCCLIEQGWNYGQAYYHHDFYKRDEEAEHLPHRHHQFLNIIGLLAGAFCIPILGGTLCLCLLSLLIHLSI